MAQTTGRPTSYTDVQRMELRSYVNLAGEVVAPLWPMRTFISRNPLQGFEQLHFDEAVRRGEQLFGGRGYLSCAAYRDAFRRGRIQSGHVDAALRPLATETHIRFGDRRLFHLDVLRAVMVHGVEPTSPGRSASAAAESPDENTDSFTQLTQRLASIPDSETWEEHESLRLGEPDELPNRTTMAAWCDRTFGTDLEDRIDSQLIKWCAAFCDEGEATWPMPGRENTFFRAWKAAAQYDLGLSLLGIKRAFEKIRLLSDRPEEVLLESLDRLKIPRSAWGEYLSRHVAALPGWAGFIKWRAEQTSYPWQEAYRIDLVKYLAVRLFYERELVAVSCRKLLHGSGDVDTAQTYARQFPHAVWFRRRLVQGDLPRKAASEAARLQRWWRASNAQAWEDLGRRWYDEHRMFRRKEAATDQARMLFRLAQALDVPKERIHSTASSDLTTLLRWLRAFPERRHGPTWLEAYELAHQHTILRELEVHGHDVGLKSQERGPVRPLAQFAFCIDVRSEVFRRHLEQRGGYETFGFAGFFGLPLAYRALGTDVTLDLCPVLLKPKHIIREVPRTYQSKAAQRQKTSTQVAKAGHELLHDLKYNVITPYVMVEAIGWFFAVPLLGRTLCPRWYHRLAGRLKQVFMPAVATTLTVDKLPTSEAEEMVAVEQRMRIVRWLRTRFQISGSTLTADTLDGMSAALYVDLPVDKYKRYDFIPMLAALGLATAVGAWPRRGAAARRRRPGASPGGAGAPLPALFARGVSWPAELTLALMPTPAFAPGSPPPSPLAITAGAARPGSPSPDGSGIARPTAAATSSPSPSSSTPATSWRSSPRSGPSCPARLCWARRQKRRPGAGRSPSAHWPGRATALRDCAWVSPEARALLASPP